MIDGIYCPRQLWEKIPKAIHGRHHIPQDKSSPICVKLHGNIYNICLILSMTHRILVLFDVKRLEDALKRGEVRLVIIIVIIHRSAIEAVLISRQNPN